MSRKCAGTGPEQRRTAPEQQQQPQQQQQQRQQQPQRQRILSIHQLHPYLPPIAVNPQPPPPPPPLLMDPEALQASTSGIQSASGIGNAPAVSLGSENGFEFFGRYGGGGGGGAEDAVGEGDGDDDDYGADTEGGGGPQKKKRRRQALSCTECKRRKIRCDRAQPCAPCVRRGDQAKCQWHVVEPTEADSEESIGSSFLYFSLPPPTPSPPSIPLPRSPQSPAPPLASSSGRDVEADDRNDNAVGEPPKKRRRRAGISCTECQRLKIRCDGTLPCKMCVRRDARAECQLHAIEPAGPHPSSSSAGGVVSRPLKGRKACLNCRFLKIKCDWVKPVCGPCGKDQKDDECEYADGPGRSRTKALEDTVARLESRLHELEHREDAMPSDMSTWAYNYPPYTMPIRYSRGPGSPSDSPCPSSLSGFSEAGSEESLGSAFLSSNQKKWDLPVYDLPTHQLILKELDLTGNVTKLDKYPVDSGGAADIYRGILFKTPFPVFTSNVTKLDSGRTPDFDGGLVASNFPVAIKLFRRMHSEPETLEERCKSLYEAARSWRRLDHPNLLSFLGISLDLGLCPALVFPLCLSGPVMRYLGVNTKDPRERLQMAIDVASGLAHLHSQGIIHGNLCTKKVLINEAGVPAICGYGMFRILGPAANTISLSSSPIRFTAPEYFSVELGTSSARTTAGDVYALSMVMLEILSGLEPYHHLPTEHAVFMHILRGDRPIQTHLDHQAVTKRIWGLLTLLWDQKPSSRPGMPDVVKNLIQIRDTESIIDGNAEPSEVGGRFVWLGALQNSGLQPEAVPPQNETGERTSSGEETTFGSLQDFHGRDLKGRIKQDDQYPFTGGGNSNIYRGKLTRSDGRKIRVAIKMIRMSDDGSQQEEMLRRLKREVDVWSRLKHKNILPFIGVCDDLAPLPVLISPFFKFGHVGRYLSKHPAVKREELVLGVASGLQFLHVNNIVHGDLKVQNVLVDKRGVPCICDFGISKIVSRRGFTTSNVGTAPYMAPELLFVIDGGVGTSHQESSYPSVTKSSDVYSFALLVLEILTSEPSKGRPTRPIVTAKILAELRPKRADYDENAVRDRTWSVLDRCWSFEPQLRPGVSEVLRDLTEGFT